MRALHDVAPARRPGSPRRMLLVLHPAFALTGILHAIGGSLLPSVAGAFHLDDRTSGSLFLFYFLGTSLGALLCLRRLSLTIALGFALVTAACLGVSECGSMLLRPLFLALGVGVGMPMTAVSLFAGRAFAGRAAAPLTLLNFSWSAGALMAPLIAARILAGHSYRGPYVFLAATSAVAAALCWLMLKDPPENPSCETTRVGGANVRLIALFALLTFLEVGVENTTATWLATYAMRSAGVGVAMAAASTSLYWSGFLLSRGVASVLLLRVPAMRMLWGAVGVAVASAIGLIALPGAEWHGVAMALLGAALAPVFPLLLAQFFTRSRNASDARWVLALCGLGGSVVPWLTGAVSTHFSCLRLGLLTVPVALLFMLLVLPTLAGRRAAEANQPG